MTWRFAVLIRQCIVINLTRRHYSGRFLSRWPECRRRSDGKRSPLTGRRQQSIELEARAGVPRFGRVLDTGLPQHFDAHSPPRRAVGVWRGGGRSDPHAAHMPANEMMKQGAAMIFCRGAVTSSDRPGNNDNPP